MQSLILHPQRLIIALATVMLLCMPNMLKAELILGTFEDPKDTDGKLIEGWYFSNGGEYGGAKGGMKLDDMDSHNGDGCLSLTADFSAGGKYVAVRKKLNLSKSEKPEKITFYIKNQSLSYLLVRVIDETGQTFQHRINVKKAVSWQKIELDKMVTKPNWGGAKDGKWHGLIYEFGILIEKQAITDGKEAQLQIDDVYINGEAPSDVSAKADTPVSTQQTKQVTQAPSKLPLPLGEFEDGTVSGWWVHRDGSAAEPYASSSNPHTGKGCMAVPIDFGNRNWMSLIRQIKRAVLLREKKKNSHLRELGLPNPRLSFRRGGLRSGCDASLRGPAGMLGAQNVIKQIKFLEGRTISAASWSISRVVRGYSLPFVLE